MERFESDRAHCRVGVGVVVARTHALGGQGSQIRDAPGINQTGPLGKGMQRTGWCFGMHG
uniref:Uncharacterized protein n=1 Tax=Oryza nivara TaxID=4536 RepID=A0A0E0GJV2_ORYNI